MPRGKRITKRKVKLDHLYHSRLVSKLINKVMRQGKKAIAQSLVYGAFSLVEERTNQKPLEVFRRALDNIKPSMEVRPRRIGGAAYQVPLPVRGKRRESLAVRWLIQAARSRSSKDYHSFDLKLAEEIIDAAQGEGSAVKKKRDTHRLAEANKAFSHFRW